MARSIARRPPSYPFEFNPFSNEAMELTAQYTSLYVIGLSDHKKARENLQKEMTRLHEQSAKGAVIGSQTWNNLEKRLESLDLEAERIKLGEQRLRYTISLATAKMYSFFADIEEDYVNGELSIDQFKRYLTKYKTLIVYIPEHVDPPFRFMLTHRSGDVDPPVYLAL